MRIDGSAYVVDISRTEPAKEAGAAAPLQRSRSGELKSFDRVEISSGPSMNQLKRDLAALPDVRLDRVALARQTLQDGGYRVAPGVLAQKMLEAHRAQ